MAAIHTVQGRQGFDSAEIFFVRAANKPAAPFLDEFAVGSAVTDYNRTAAGLRFDYRLAKSFRMIV